MQNIEQIQKRLTRLMAISIIITLVSLGAVFSAIIYKLHHESPLAEQQYINLTKSEEILEQRLSGDIISFLIKNGQQRYLLIYNYKTAKILTKINLDQH